MSATGVVERAEICGATALTLSVTPVLPAFGATISKVLGALPKFELPKLRILNL